MLKQLQGAVQDLLSEGKTHTEKSGEFGVNEYQYSMVNLFGEIRKEVIELHEGILNAFNGWARADNYKAIIQEYQEALPKAKESRLVIDNRRTAEEQEETTTALNELEQKHAAERDDKDRLIGLGDPEGRTLETSQGEMALTISAYFDDSDIRSDYFRPHALLSGSFVVAVVKKQARTEQLARSIVNQFPELAALNWTWHVEEWSMGHGTYLESDAIAETEHRAYDGREKVSYWYEISFDTYTSSALRRARWFYNPDNGCGKLSERGAVQKNEEKNGIEVKFPGKPSEDVITLLKVKGFRWSRAQRLWYRRFDESLYSELKERFA
jgi:hypothetical protein